MTVSSTLVVFKITFTTAVICRSVCNEMSLCYCPYNKRPCVPDPGFAGVVKKFPKWTLVPCGHHRIRRDILSPVIEYMPCQYLVDILYGCSRTRGYTKILEIKSRDFTKWPTHNLKFTAMKNSWIKLTFFRATTVVLPT